MFSGIESAVPSFPAFQNALGTQTTTMSGDFSGSWASPTASLDPVPSLPRQPAASRSEQIPPADVFGVVHPAKHDLGITPSQSSSLATAPGPFGHSAGTAIGGSAFTGGFQTQGGSPPGPFFKIPALPDTHESPIASYTDGQPSVSHPSHAATAPNPFRRSAFLPPTISPTSGQPARALAARSSSSPSEAFGIIPAVPQFQSQPGPSPLAPASAAISNQLSGSPHSESVFASTTDQLPVSSRPGSAFAITPKNQPPGPSLPASVFAASVFANTANQPPAPSRPGSAFAVTPNQSPTPSLPASAFANTETQVPDPSPSASVFAASAFASTANQPHVLPPTLENLSASPFVFRSSSPLFQPPEPVVFSADSGSGSGHPTGLSWGGTSASLGTAFAARGVPNADSPRAQVHESQTTPASAPSLNTAPVFTNGPNTDGASKREDDPRLPESFVASPPEPTRDDHSKLKRLLRSPVVISEIATTIIDSIVAREAKKTIQDFRQQQTLSICEEIANDYYPLQEKALSVALARDLVAENCYARRLTERIFYPWKRKGRKLLAKRKRTERLRKPLKPVPLQWQPVYYPDNRGPDREVFCFGPFLFPSLY